MEPGPLVPIPGHAIFLLLIQCALLLFAARVGSEVSRRLGLPAVVGELAGGILLGPTVFGHFAPGVYGSLFPHVPFQYQLLDVVGLLGMVTLLLLTGLETDLRLLRNLGRPALVASASGMVMPFALGFGLGWLLPEDYLADPGQRLLFSLFLATAMSISAMPVIAKILMDLDLTRRNIGLVILSAGVVDDTAGWLILSLLAGAATHGGFGAAQFGALGRTLGYLLAFLVGMVFVVYPILRWVHRWAAERAKSRDTDLVLIVMITFVAAAVTELIGVHAVFGAFVVGCAFRQVPRLRPETLHRLEGFVFAVLAPVFFGIVGLKVDLWQLGGWGIFGIVFAVACTGKLVGCTVGGLWAGMRFWEASSIAVAMNARGAMELVVATIGLSLGILNQTMFSVIVMVAITTSFMAPLALRLTTRFVRISDEEARRIAAAVAPGAFPADRLRVLVPTAGGPNALAAARVGFALARKSESPLSVLFVEEAASLWQRVKRLFVKSHAGVGIDAHLARIKELANGARPPEVRRVRSARVADAILEESRVGYDLVVMGASPHGASLGGEILADVVGDAPCHVAVIRAPEVLASFKHILVPVDGSLVSKVAVELAVSCAEALGAELTLGFLREHRPQAEAWSDESGVLPLPSPPPPASPGPEQLARLSGVFKAVAKQPKTIYVDYDPSTSALAAAVATGGYDLVVIGAENRAIQHRLFFGYDTERLTRHAEVAVAVVVPNVHRLGK
jgi:Kef-type K+ transport system membrane component KefB/nucleotide-binding universal stress UspA family protein